MSHNPVVINLGVEIDTSGELIVFAKDTVAATTDVIVCEVELPARCLYDVDNTSGATLYNDPSDVIGNSLIEFRETSNVEGDSSLNDIVAMFSVPGPAQHDLANPDPSGHEGRNYKLMLKDFVYELHEVLKGDVDLSDAAPFKGKYDNIEAHRSAPSLGRAFLMSYADRLFGHVAATAAISNDKQFIEFMNGPAYATMNEVDLDTDDVKPSIPSLSGEKSGAGLAARLVRKLIENGESNAKTIAEQVIGQDATRAMNSDNNHLSPENWHALKFVADDVIYFKIKLADPTLKFGTVAESYPSSTVQKEAADLISAVNSTVNDITYTIKITLS
jgi:hypothetical protein